MNKIFTCLLLPFLAGPVAAEVIEYQFSGTVINVQEEDNSFGGLNIGDPFWAGFAFDTLSPDLLTDDPAMGRYNALSASLDIPNFNVVQSGGVLNVSDGITWDSLLFDSSGNELHIVAVFKGMPTSISDDSLPMVFPLMDETQVLNVFAVSGDDKFAGTITSAIVIPEPSCLVLILAGGFCFWRRQV